MARLFGAEISREALADMVGDPLQVAGIRQMRLADGREADVRIADVRTGSGLRFQVTLDRGMDLSLAEYKGIPLSWRSPGGDVHPAYFDPRGSEWQRTFPGGLMTGCGLTYLGAACVDEGSELGLHGRLSHLPATNVNTSTRWEGDQCVMTLEGMIRESRLFGDNLLLHRSMEVHLGESTIRINDTITNEGGGRTPLMMLYHFNLGWPLVDDGSMLLLNTDGLTSRDADAEQGRSDARRCSRPVKGFREQVFYSDLHSDAEGFATALLLNNRLKLGFFLRFRQEELPRFILMRMMGEGVYMVGMEPANCLVEGRAKERERGTLQFLDPGEDRRFFLLAGVLEGETQITSFTAKHNLQ